VAVVGFLLLVVPAVLLMAGSELFAEHASAAGAEVSEFSCISVNCHPLFAETRRSVHEPAAPGGVQT
jgi:hypothetical protein